MLVTMRQGEWATLRRNSGDEGLVRVSTSGRWGWAVELQGYRLVDRATGEPIESSSFTIEPIPAD